MNRPYDQNQSLDRMGYVAAFNEGLRVYMQKVFGLMGLAVAFSGLVSYIVGNNMEIAQVLYMSPMRYVVIFAPLIVVLLLMLLLVDSKLDD